MGDNGFDVEAVVARVKQWLAEGKDVRLVATRAAVRDFPMIEMRNGGGVEVITRAGIIREGVEPPSQKRDVTPPPPAARVQTTLPRQRRPPSRPNHRAASRPLRAQP
jgi:hypothetical protein